MRTVTFLVLEGVDKGRVYKDLPIPVTIGREEGNGLRLNDEPRQPLPREGPDRGQRHHPHGSR